MLRVRLLGPRMAITVPEAIVREPKSFSCIVMSLTLFPKVIKTGLGLRESALLMAPRKLHVVDPDVTQSYVSLSSSFVTVI